MFIFAISSVLILGCSTNQSSVKEEREPRVWVMEDVTPEEKQSAIQTVAFELKDPESARFKDVWALKSSFGTRIICGYVNGKNSYGAYTGYKTFAILDDSIFFEGSGFVGQQLPRMCMPRTDYD